MRNYLEQMGTAPYTAVREETDPLTLIAALGPKMLELAKTHTKGRIRISLDHRIQRWHETFSVRDPYFA